MWEQFSFFGMRALLVLYMVKQLHIPQAKASWVYGLYAACVYATPIAGGYITDRWLGRRRAVVIGGLIMALGHFFMAFEPLLYLALATIALGNGFFLPSLASQIDSLYAPGDPRRRSAYNIYYMGINLGAFAAPFVIGTVGEAIGFHWGFALAGIGMVIGLCTYLVGGRYLPAQPKPGPPAPTATVSGATAPGDSLSRRFTILIAIAGAVVVFRGAYEQIGNTISLFADQSVDRQVFSDWAIPVTWFQSLNPLIVFALTPVFVARWNRLAERGRDASSVIKMVIGAATIGGSYLLLSLVAWQAGKAGVQVSWIWLAAFIVVMTAGELYILPVGLGLFGRLAPQGLSATTIATWFGAGFFGNILAGWLGGLWQPLGRGAFFTVIGLTAVAAAVLLRLLAAPARRLERAAMAVT